MKRALLAIAICGLGCPGVPSYGVGTSPDGGPSIVDGSSVDAAASCPSNPTRRRAFVTSDGWAGDFGGNDPSVAARERCTTAGNRFKSGAKWDALVWIGNTPAVQRIRGVGPWFTIPRKVDCTDYRVFESWEALRDKPPEHAILVTELGELVSTMSTVWSGGPANEDAGTTFLQCLRTDGDAGAPWSNLAAQGTYGAAIGGLTWLLSSNGPCTNQRRLYCFELDP